MRILDENFGNAKPCHDDLKTYLQVNYRCVKGKLISYLKPDMRSVPTQYSLYLLNPLTPTVASGYSYKASSCARPG